jgi:hypothetical protein
LKSQAAFGKQEQASSRGLPEEFSQFVTVFTEAETLFYMFFTKTKILKTLSAHTKGSVSIFRTFKKYSSRNIIYDFKHRKISKDG